jgi:hypothetical protein
MVYSLNANVFRLHVVHSRACCTAILYANITANDISHYQQTNILSKMATNVFFILEEQLNMKMDKVIIAACVYFLWKTYNWYLRR